MSENMPETVFDPAYIDRAVLRNLTTAIQKGAGKAATATFPLMISNAAGLPIKEEQWLAAMAELMKIIAINAELAQLIDNLYPISNEYDNAPDETKAAITAVIEVHPTILEAIQHVKAGPAGIVRDNAGFKFEA